MRDIKFRQFIPEIRVNDTVIGQHFNYWGYTEPKYPKLFSLPLSSDQAEPSQQFTGLKDKNGLEIYEGDIVTMKDISGSGQVRTFPPKEVRWEDTGFNISQWDSEADCEVIGNIYENKELLK